MTNPLVEKQPESNDGFITQGSGDAGWTSGIGIAESVNDVSSLNEGSSWVESGLAYGGLAMEGISLAVDPIGTLLSYGLSWLIEHVHPLKEALDWFGGDPDGVAAYGKTWENVSKAVEEAASQYEDAVKADTASWTGAAGDAYRRTAAEKGEALAGAAKLAGTISSVVTIMGEVVSFVREFVRDLVADCISRLITYALEALLPPIASLAWVIPQAIAFISKTVTKIADIVGKLTRTISNVSPKLAKLAEVFGDIMETLGDKGKAGAGAIGKVAEKLDVAERLAEKTWKKVDDTFGTDVVGKHNAKFGGRDAPGSGDGESSTGSGAGESGPRSSSGAPGQGDSPSSARSESTGETGSPRSESTPDGAGSGESAGGRGDVSPDSRSNADSGGSTRTDAGSGTQDVSNSGGSARSDTGSQSQDGSGPAGSNRTDSGTGTQDAPNSGGSTRSDSGSGSQSQADSSPSSQPHADSGGPQARPDSGTSSQPHADAGGSPRADTGSSNAGSGGSTSGAHTSDVPRAPASTSAAAVDAPARPDAAAPQSAPAAPRPDQPSGNAPAGGPGAPASPSAPGGATPSPRGGRQGPGGWTGTSGHPGAVRDLPGNAPRTPRSPSHPAGPRPDAPAHAPRGPMPPRQAPHAPAPMRPVRSGAPAAPVRRGTPVQRPQSAPPRSPHLRTADSPRTPIPAQRAPETPNSPAEQPKPDEPRVSTAESMAAETPPKDQWQAGHHMVDHTPRLNISPELRDKLGPFRRDIEATGAGLSFTKPPVKDYFGRAEWAHKRPRCSVDPNRFTVEMHGGPNGVKFKHIDLDAKELAEIIRGSSGYKEGTPIRLVSCETGADVPDGSKNFAQQLSEELGVEVLAPNTNAWVDNHGNIYASESSAKFDEDESGSPKPRLDSPGEWTAFRPDGTKAVHSSPYPPGHQPEWVRHGVQAERAQIRGIFGRRKDEDFSIDPVTGHNYSNAPPQGQFGPPPQNHGYHPQGYQQPQHQGYPQQGYPQQGYQPQTHPHQGYPQAGPAQPHPQPSAPPHYSNQPYQGYPQPNSTQGYPQHSAPQNHPQQSSGGYPQQPQHVSQQGGYSPHPQPPQQGAYHPPQHPQGGYVPPQQPAHAQPRPSSPQQQGFPPQGGRPNAFPSSNPAQPWHGARNTPTPVQGGHGPGAQPQQPHGHAPNSAAPNSNPPTPGASGHPQTPRNNATPQRPSASQQPAAPNPRLQQAGPPAGHQPAAPPGGGASRQLDGAGPAAPNGPAAATPSKPVLDDFTPAQPATPSTAGAPAGSSWKSDFGPAGSSKPAPIASSSHATPSTSKPVLDDFDPGPVRHEAPHTPNKVEDDFAPKGAPQQQAPWSNVPRGSTTPEAPRSQDSTRSSSAGANEDFHRPAAPGQNQSSAGGTGQPNSPHGASQPVPSAGSPHVQGGGSPSFPPPPDVTPSVRSFEDFLRDNGFAQGALVPDAPKTDAPELGDRNPLDEFDFFGDKDFRATADDHSALRQLGKVLSDAELQEIRTRRPDIDHITDEEISAMYVYTGIEHQYWNEALRGADVEEVRKYETLIRNAVSGMNKLPDWTPATVHRGIQIDAWDMDNFLDRYLEGEEVTENAFTSSSKADPFPGNVEFVIEAREGKDLEFLRPYSGMSEVAWPPGNRFRVDRREYDSATEKWTIHLTDLGR
ncbi:hypothetical protein E1202_10375 [Saccharopolyspora karakumensis]|uniref:NAD(+)--protein-arginine ADP-ribosyltransferase n=1 Tax=Saccharopolyspora karakumensis TaxID=2530386 RepID=A0A4R5BWC9_9PSEU|nr:hypothetical protein [Saccharopolyspora karakumensis]TDD89680.1 hypothetical protein E1202_10375 [Saccharopolyspora karakumensis]